MIHVLKYRSEGNNVWNVCIHKWGHDQDLFVKYDIDIVILILSIYIYHGCIIYAYVK